MGRKFCPAAGDPARRRRLVRWAWSITHTPGTSAKVHESLGIELLVCIPERVSPLGLDDAYKRTKRAEGQKVNSKNGYQNPPPTHPLTRTHLHLFTPPIVSTPVLLGRMDKCLRAEQVPKVDHPSAVQCEQVRTIMPKCPALLGRNTGKGVLKRRSSRAKSTACANEHLLRHIRESQVSLRPTAHGVLEYPDPNYALPMATSSGYTVFCACTSKLKKHFAMVAPKLRLAFRLARPLQCVHPQLSQTHAWQRGSPPPSARQALA